MTLDVTRETLVALLDSAAARMPEGIALAAPGRRPLTHPGLQQHVRRTAAALSAAGIGRRDVVALVVENGPEAASAFLAVAAAAVCAPLNPAYRASELDFYLDDLDARLVVVGTGVSGPVREVAAARGIDILELAPAVDDEAGVFTLSPDGSGAVSAAGPAPDDVALVLHTSGTTSRPKLVPLSHRNLTASARNVAAVLQLSERDRCLNVMPLFHIHGLVAALLASLHAGGSVACTPGFHPVKVFDWARELQPTWLTAVPTMLQAVLARVEGDRSLRTALAGLRFLRSSSSSLPESVLEGLERELSVPVIEAYGMTEAAHQMASNRLPPAERVPGWVGAAAGPDIAVLDERGAELPPGHLGEVAIRGVNVFAGYVANPTANAAAFTNGWFRTGDEGQLDGNGRLRLSGRIKEIINRGGEKVAPAEIDDVLLRHPAVAQAVTFAVPDPRLGEEVGAAVVLVDGASAGQRELQDFVAQTVAPFKVPRTIVIVDEIPKGATGKLQRIGLHERLGIEPFVSVSQDAALVAPRSYPERLVARVWCEVLEIPEIGMNDDFFALGGDSILGAEAVARIRDLTGRDDLPLVSIVRAPTVASFMSELEDVVTRDGRSLVAVQQGDGGRPFHLVHGVDGDVLGFAALARRLDPSRPFYGLRARDLDRGELLHRSVEEMASAYVEEIVAEQPSGPYLLGGVCAGGPVAIEMARQLTRSGEEVAQLVLIDPRLRPRRTPAYYAWRFQTVRQQGRLGEFAVARARRLVGRGPVGEVGFDAQIAAVRDAYVLQPLDVPATLLACEDYDRLGVPVSVWQHAFRGLRQRRFRGEHLHLFLPPTIDHLAAALRSAFDEARA